jgi:glycosyltransferase involved in cell wall biosynthesis
VNTNGRNLGTKLAACLITKNEERYIDRILGNIEDHVDGIFIYDTGSEDRTVELATKRGAVCVAGEWRNDFAWARNQSYALAGEDFAWKVYFDADDEVTGAEHLRELAADALPWVDSFDFPYHNDWGGIEVNYYTKRMVRTKAGYRWRYPLHEQLETDDGRDHASVRSDLVVWSQKHSMEDRRDKTERNLQVLLSQPNIQNPDEWLAAGVVFTLVEQGKAREAYQWLIDRGLTFRIEGCS